MGAAVLAAGWITGWQRSITACFDSPPVDRLQSTTSDHGGAMVGVALMLWRSYLGGWWEVDCGRFDATLSGSILGQDV